MDIITLLAAAFGTYSVYWLVKSLLSQLILGIHRLRARRRGQIITSTFTRRKETRLLGDRLSRLILKYSFGKRFFEIFQNAHLPMSFGAFLERFLEILFLSCLLVLIITHNVLSTILIFLGLLIISIYVLRQRSHRRIEIFKEQLPIALITVANAMSAGTSLEKALERAAEETPPPLSPELRRVVEDMQVGYTLEQALEGLRKRVPLEELDAILASILIQRRTGGNLPDLLENTARILQRDIRLRRDLMVLTAQTRVSAQIVGLAPFVLGALFLATNPSYRQVALKNPLGIALIFIALFLEVIGYFAIRRLIDIKI